MKKILQNIDKEKSNYVKQDVFFQLLPLHKINIDDSSKQKLVKDFGNSSNKINYKDALANLSVDLSAQEPLISKWIIRNADTARSNLLKFNQTISAKLSQEGNQQHRGSRSIRSFSINDRQNEKKRAQQQLYQSIQEVEEVDQPYREFKDARIHTKSRSMKISPRQNMKSQDSDSQDSRYMSQNQVVFVNPSKVQKIEPNTNEIRKMSEKEPEKFSKINQLMRSLQQAGIDIRCLETLRLKLNGISEILIKDFKLLIIDSLKLHSTQLCLMDEIMESIMVWTNSTFKQDNQLVSREVLNDFLNLCHYWPLAVKRLSNASQNMYKIMNADKVQDHETSLEFHKQNQDFKQSQIYRLLTLLNSKIHEKFDKIVQAYLFFSGNQMKKITLNEFIISLENLRIKLSTKEVNDIFEYLDRDKDGCIDYKEFCNIAEEKWKGIDPFDDQNHKHTQQHFMRQRSTSINGLSPEDAYKMKLIQPPKLDEFQEPQSFEKDAMIDSYNVYRGYKTRTIKRENMMLNSFGVKSLKSDDIKDLLSNLFQDQSFDQKNRTSACSRIENPSEGDGQQSLKDQSSQRNKIFKQFHTKASEKRDEKVKQQLVRMNQQMNDEAIHSQDITEKDAHRNQREHMSPKKLDDPSKQINSFRNQSVDKTQKVRDAKTTIQKPVHANLNDLINRYQDTESHQKKDTLPQVVARQDIHNYKNIFSTPEYMKTYANKQNNRLLQPSAVQEHQKNQKTSHPSSSQSRTDNSAMLKEYYSAKRSLKPVL